MGVGRFRHIWSRMGKAGQVWMGQTYGRELVICLVVGCRYACRSRDGYRWMWAKLGVFGQI